MTSTALSRFTASDYEAILEAVLEHGYAFAKFVDADPKPEARVVYLRHDIDNCIESALRMAEIEARYGAVATYLVMVRSENYNPFSAASVGGLRRIVELGHDLGLHFSAEEHDPEAVVSDLMSCILADAKLLESAIGTSVRVFSFHNPTENDHIAIDVPGLVNTYADRFFADACYLSDSNMRWSHGSPVDVLTSGQHRVIQILVHPLSFEADFRTDRDVLRWFLREKLRKLLELNTRQNRVLREDDLESLDMVALLADEKADP